MHFAQAYVSQAALLAVLIGVACAAIRGFKTLLILALLTSVILEIVRERSSWLHKFGDTLIEHGLVLFTVAVLSYLAVRGLVLFAKSLTTQQKRASTTGKDAGCLVGRDRYWAMAANLVGVSNLLLPLAGVLLTAAIWAYNRKVLGPVREASIEALNFQIIWSTALVACILLGLFVDLVGPVLIAVVLFGIVLMLIAAMRAYQGVVYRYPLILRFIS